MCTLVDGVTKSMGNGIRSTWQCVRLSVPISGWSQQRSRLDTQLEDAPQEVRHAQQEHAWSEAQTHVQHV